MEHNRQRPNQRHDLMFFVAPVGSNRDHAGPFWVRFEDAAVDSIAHIPYTSVAAGLLFHPTIIDSKKGPEWALDERVIYKRDGFVELYFKINYDDWNNGSEAAKLEMLARGIENALKKIKNSSISRGDRDRIMGSVNSAASLLKQRL